MRIFYEKSSGIAPGADERVPGEINVEIVVVHYIEVSPFSWIISEADISCVYFIQAVELQKCANRKFRVDHDQSLNAREMDLKVFAPGIKYNVIVLIKE